jgi:outer membrane protein insertion porin family
VIRRIALASLASLALLAVACGPGPTGEPKTEASRPKKPVADCPPRPPAPDADFTKLARLAGKHIAKMCLYGLEGDNRATAQKALRSHEGDPIDLERVREDIGALLKSGVVDDAVISALPSGDEIILLYALKERPRIAEVGFEGAHVFEKEGLTGKIAMEKLRPLVQSEVADLMTAMREEYSRRGYRSVKIESKTESAGPGLVKLKFVVNEGPQWKIGKVTLEGPKKVPVADLKKVLALEPSTPFDEEKIDRGVLAMQSLYFDRGMINVRIERAVGEPDKDGSTPLTFTIDEGDVFRVGSIKLGKLASGDEKTLLAKLKTKPNAVFNRSVLVDDVKTLTDTFAARGQKVEVVPRTDVDAKKKTMAVTLDVEAAPQ